MKKNEEICNLSEEIMINISEGTIPLHIIMLKALRLSLLLDMPQNVDLFKQWAKFAESNEITIETYKLNMHSAVDPDISISSSNTYEHVGASIRNQNNKAERLTIMTEINKFSSYQANYRMETFNFVVGIYNKWKFGNMAEAIFEKKRKRIEIKLVTALPDIKERFNSIELNINSNNSEDWKNAVGSCRALLMDLADSLNPTEIPEDKPKYLNRLKDVVSPLIKSKTKTKLIKNYYDELKNRLEYIQDLTQGGSHKDRPLKNEAEDIVLHTYLIIGDLVEIYYADNKSELKETTLKE